MNKCIENIKIKTPASLISHEKILNNNKTYHFFWILTLFLPNAKTYIMSRNRKKNEAQRICV